MISLLQTKNVNKTFGGLAAVSNLDMNVDGEKSSD